MELIDQPSSNCPGDFLAGKLYVAVKVNRCRMSKSLFPYCSPGFALLGGKGLAFELLEASSRAWE